MSCVLRKWRMSDAKDLAKTLNNEKILNNLRDGLPFPYTEQDAYNYIVSMLSSDENSTFAYAITKNDIAIGSIAAFRQNNIHRQTAEIGYYLSEEYWGRGIMTQAIRRLCDILFETTDIIRIYAEPFAYNTPSRRALEKAGFRYEGTMKNNAVKNGKILDMTLYSITRTTQTYPVRRLNKEEIPEAKELCLRVFLEFVAPEYSPEGVAAFQAALNDPERTRRLVFYGCFDGDKLIGVLYMREPQHIGGFFVDALYQQRGIGRRLFDAMRLDYSRQVFTVNSSPYAVKIYSHLGFKPIELEQTVNGLRFTPMLYNEKSTKSNTNYTN